MSNGGGHTTTGSPCPAVITHTQPIPSADKGSHDGLVWVMVCGVGDKVQSVTMLL